MTLLQFDHYEIDIDQRRLTESGQPLRLGGRAFDILAALISRAGQVITKEELIGLVWPTTTVDEGSLRVHLVALRKTLGDRAKHYVETIPGRGYVFSGEVRKSVERQDASPPKLSSSNELLGSLPRIPRKLIGRDEFIRSTLEHFTAARLITIVGPGGIGKTSAAVVCAQGISDAKRVVFMDLTAIADGDNLLPSLATQLGLNTFGEDALPGILAELARIGTLLVLDSCERIIDAAANAAEAILRGSPDTQILATSREPLRASMERVRHLPPLGFPPDGEEISDPRSYPAVELFISLAALAGDSVDLADNSGLQLASDIVRRLDGIPLAIELAAARSFDMDLPTLHRSVADPIALLRRGRRTAPPRQHTLQATLDWSFATLSDDEKELLIRISVFAGTFSPDAAMSVAGDGLQEDRFHEAFDGLFLKSLLVVMQHGGTFRLLGTTRDYARQKLGQADFSLTCRRAHALYCKDRLLLSSREWWTTDSTLWRVRNAELIHDLRAALAWAFEEDGDEYLAIELSAISDTLWVQLGLVAEQLLVSERALRLFETRRYSDPSLEMKLRMSYGSALYHSKTFSRNAEVLSEYDRVLEMAVAAENTTKVQRAIVGITAIQTSNGDYQGAIDLVHKFERWFEATPPQIPSRILNHNLHYIGDFNGAMEQASIALEPERGKLCASPNSGSSFNPRISALCTIVKTHWIQGRFTAARTALRDTLEEVVVQDHAISTCLFLAASACPTALAMGDFELGIELLEKLRNVSVENSLLRWREWASCYEAVLEALRNDDGASFNYAVSRVKGAPFENCLVIAGSLANSETLGRVTPQSNWCGAEVLRLKGELVMHASPEQGLDLLLEGFELAGKQAAATFELRCATSLLRHAPPHDVKRSYDRLEGALNSVEPDDTVADFAIAKALLGSLGG
jgi:predicted ATPase/DNA-binding winged helix-turn-helix (wHTH) protein